MASAARPSFAALLVVLVLCTRVAAAGDSGERGRRPDFSQKPRVARKGDRVTIAFATEGRCDVTVAIEDRDGRIVRHLACGVLGPNAPEPFAKGSLKQTIVWDGKNDQGKYIDDKDALAVRVSLGLKPMFERVLLWEPRKRMAPKAPIFVATKEGMYVYEGYALDHLRLFDHKGSYVRTIYPFPADKLRAVLGLEWRRFPQLGARQPLRRGSREETLLTSGVNGRPSDEDGSDEYKSADSAAASAMAVRGGRIALAMYTLNRLATDGSSGGLGLNGPQVEFTFQSRGRARAIVTHRYIPGDAAFSPDGKWLYLTGYHYFHRARAAWIRWADFAHGVAKVAFEGDARPQVFKGVMTKQGAGSGDDRFNHPTSVACDAKGNVYVADYVNDRVQVFEPDGALLRSLKVDKPTVVRVHPKTGEVYVFSWILPVRPMLRGRKKVAPALRVFGPDGDAKERAAYRLPFVRPGPFGQGFHMGTDRDYSAEVDFWTDPPTVWLGFGLRQGDWGRGEFGTGRGGEALRSAWSRAGVKLLMPEGGRLVVKRDFGADTVRSVKRARPPRRHAQHLFVNPRTGKLYVLEYMGLQIDGLDELIEIDPATGRVALMKLPFQFEDLAFDSRGLAYLQTQDIVLRFDLDERREVPFDYGEERTLHNKYRVASGLSLRSFAGWHHWSGKIAVSVRGRIAVAARTANIPASRRKGDEGRKSGWEPKLFPGRAVGEYIHVWDRHGKLVFEDALPGLAGWSVGGIGIDKNDDLAVVVNSRCLAKGKAFFRPRTGALLKVTPTRIKLLSGSSKIPVPLPAAERPKRQPELRHGWVEGAAWMFGGVGFNTTGFHCLCWHSSFALDYFGRSFAPQPNIYRVAVLDANGNVILRVGRYGNADSAGPKSLVPLGGDEVGLFTPNYVATHTDRRLFIADAANARILSVKLGYHRTETVHLKDVPDTADVK